MGAKISKWLTLPPPPFFSSDLSQALWWIRQSYGNKYMADLTKNVVLLHFNIGINGKIVKCAISWKRPIIDQNKSKCVPCGHGMSEYSLRSILGHSVHFAKFPMLTFSKGSHSFHPISTRLYRAHVIAGITGYYFSGDLPNFQRIWHFEDNLPELYCQYP